MKYSKLDLGQIEAVANKLGGMDGVKRFLQDDFESVVLRNLPSLSGQIKRGWIQNQTALAKNLREVLAPPATPIKHIIDCDSVPFIPNGLRIAEESLQIPTKVRGKLEFDPNKIDLYLPLDREHRQVITIDELREELLDKPVLPANVLDFLLGSPEFIPSVCGENKCVSFWGTIYCDAMNNPGVRCLYRDGSWGVYWLTCCWSLNHKTSIALLLTA